MDTRFILISRKRRRSTREEEDGTGTGIGVIGAKKTGKTGVLKRTMAVMVKTGAGVGAGIGTGIGDKIPERTRRRRNITEKISIGEKETITMVAREKSSTSGDFQSSH